MAQTIKRIDKQINNTCTQDKDPFCIAEEIAQAPRPIVGRMSNICDFYNGRSVLITGASGFIGKVLIEKLLRTCPIKRVFVLIRPKWNNTPEQRLKELLESMLFESVRHDKSSTGLSLEQRVVLVEGDVTQANLGLSGENLLRILREVSVIFHSAATVKFDEPLKQSIGINIAGTKNMIDICRRIPHLAALVHVSTAYANCDLNEIDEHIYPVDMDPEKLIQMADWLDQDTLQELKRRLLGAKPNTYTYTKALAEWLIVKSARDLPVVICRPSIVVASATEPVRGWIDNVNGPTGVLLGAAKGLVRSMYADTDLVADLVPVDTVINLMITLGWFAYINKNQKHLNDNVSESFTESLINSDGPSSVAGSSAASTSDGGDESFDEHMHQLNQQSGTDESSLSFGESPNNNNDNQKHHNNNNDNHHHQHHLHHHHLNPSTVADDGYGSRSSDYANSIASSDSAVSLRLNKRSGTTKIGSSKSNQVSRNIQDRKTSSTTLTECSLKALESNNNNNNSDQTIAIKEHGSTSLIDVDSDVDGCLNDIEQQNVACNDNVESGHKSLVSNELECKLKRFRQRTKAKLLDKDLPEELADVPVFHCTSGGENPITWGYIQIIVMAACSVFPSSSTYRYPCGSFTKNTILDKFYRMTLHYFPAYIVDFVTRICGGKPILVKIFTKFDTAAKVLKTFTSKQWHFHYDNRLFLLDELMNDEDKRLFNCDIKELNWTEFCHDYVIGVRKFLLKEPLTNLQQARRNLTFVYWRNLSLQVLLTSTITYYLYHTIYGSLV